MRPANFSLLAVLILTSLARAAPAPETVDTAAEASVDAAAERAAALADRQAWEQIILELEAREGIYAVELSEAYVGLGNSLRRLEQHADAAEAFGKALQTLRIGYGLNDPRQLPVLEQLRDTNTELQNWDEVHSAQHLMFRIAKLNADNELRVRSLLDLGHWMRRARTEDLLSAYETDFFDLRALYNYEIGRLEDLDDYEGKSLHLAALYLELAGAELEEAQRKFELPITAFQGPGPGEQRYTTPPTCFVVLDRSGRPTLSCTAPTEVPNMNYYLAPNLQKNTEIRQHLSIVESRVTAAYNTLREEPAANPEDQALLLEEVQRLTSEYNKFVEMNPGPNR